MNTSVKENITANVFDTLADISFIDGYNNDAIAEREQVRGTRTRDRLLVISDDGDTPKEDLPVQKDEYDASYSIKCFVMVSDRQDGTEPILDVVKAKLVADVRKALMQDYSRGGWAINTIVNGDSPLSSDERAGYDGRSLSVTVHFRTAKDDPYSV